MLRVLTIFGTRPEAIKMAPVVAELRRRAGVTCGVAVTAQHRQMLDQMLAVFDLQADDDLDLMRPDQDLADLTASVITTVTDLLVKRRPDVVLVQGDTTTAMAAALAAFYRRIAVGHVEAGLRTNDVYYPFPEEVNRRLIAGVATYHFAPTLSAQQALVREGVPLQRIYHTGNPVVDALRHILERHAAPQLPIAVNGRRLVLLTAHRRENFGRPLEQVCAAVRELVRRHADIEVVYPVHPNPNVRSVVGRSLGGLERVHLLEPLDYVSMVHLMQRAHLILTDSGGVQEEAPILGRPVLVLRDETERPEGVAAGVAQLVGTDPPRIVAAASLLLSDAAAYRQRARRVNLYGDGRAARRIVTVLVRETRQPLAARGLPASTSAGSLGRLRSHNWAVSK
jgi:UDP-N-acetylglucosamine 2-epimerase